MQYGLTKTRVRLAGGAAILALSASAAMAQEGVEQVVVSSSRLQAAGCPDPHDRDQRGGPASLGQVERV